MSLYDSIYEYVHDYILLLAIYFYTPYIILTVYISYVPPSYVRTQGTVVDGVVTRMFSGKLRSYIRCVNVDYVSTREEDFYDLQLDVKGCKDIYASFDKYIAKEMLTGDNQYDAESLGKQVCVYMYTI